MNNIGVNAQAIAALKAMRNELSDQTTQLKQEIATLKEAYETNQQGLGPHAESIRMLLEELGVHCEESGKPVRNLMGKLQVAAMLRQRVLDEDQYSGAARR